MMRRQVAFIANSLDNAYKFRQVLLEIGVDVLAGSTAQMKSILKPGSVLDLVVFEAIGPATAYLGEVISLAENQGIPLLAIVDESGLANLRLPDQIACDFVVAGARSPECSARVRRLIDVSGPSSATDEIVVDDMVINLSTYQVSIAGEPLDLTYLEYALLAFFARHPGHTFSRDALLQNVWGFDYYGGSRTVDVHVRRIRAKLGPGLAEHLETVRGVGYLWKAKV